MQIWVMNLLNSNLDNHIELQYSFNTEPLRVEYFINESERIAKIKLSLNDMQLTPQASNINLSIKL